MKTLDKKWFKENDIEAKLKATLEAIVVGNGWEPLDGLQSGSVTVKLVHDGNQIVMLPTKKSKPKTVKVEPTVAVVESPTEPEETEETEKEEKTKK